MEETLRTFFSQHYELFFTAIGIFFMISAWLDWNWIFDPPYDSIKNPIGFWFGRKACRFTVFIGGILIVLLMLFII